MNLEKFTNKINGALVTVRIGVEGFAQRIVRVVCVSIVKSMVNNLKRKARSKYQSASSASSSCVTITNFQDSKMYIHDLVKRAGKLSLIIGHDEEIQRIIEIFSKSNKKISVLTCKLSVDYTVVGVGLAQRIVRGDVPRKLADVKIIALDTGALVVGAQSGEEIEGRLKAALKQLEEAKAKVIVFIDDIHLVLGGAMVTANLFKLTCARGQLVCIGMTTLEEYMKYVDKDAAFERRFPQIYAAGPNVVDILSIVRGLKEKYEGHHGI